MTTLCSNCGFNNPPGMRFCGNCGTPLADTPAPSVVTPPAPSITERFGVMMGRDLQERFRKAGLEAAGQRRNVTILFADLCGYTGISERIDSEDLYDLVQHFIRTLVENVYKYEGTVDKIMGDGLMALFGAPIAYENNAERAVRAALDMHSDVARLSQELKHQLGFELDVHIGLHAGSVIIGGLGSDMMMDYTAVGDTVNLASRLGEAASPGTILVSESVQRMTKALFDFETVPPLSLKGIRKPVPGHRLIGMKARPGPVRGLEGLRAPLVGRDVELGQLESALQRLVNDRQGQLVLITGEAGIGKSRLIAELKARISSDSHPTVVDAQSLAYRRAASYWVFLDLLRNYLKVTPETPSTLVHDHLMAKTANVLGPQATDVLLYLEHLLSLEHTDPAAAERLAYLEASQLRQQIFLAVRDLLVAEARANPLLLILDDLHWADDTSLALLTFLVDSINQVPLTVFAISRPFQDGALGKLVNHARKWLDHRFFEIQLQSLSPDQSEHLFYELLAIPELPDKLRNQILERAAGIPFYLEEILRTLIDGRMIQQENGRWKLVEGADYEALGVPDTLEGLILARFDSLESFQRSVMQAASVIGRQFNIPLLLAILQTADDVPLLDTLSLLVERGFILSQAGVSGTEYLFRHMLTTDAVYSTLLRRDRSELHGRVGEAIESLYVGRIESQIEVLAGHYLRSTRLDRALHYLTLAGQKAERAYANEQARWYYEQALELIPRVGHTPEQVLQIRMGLGDVLTLIGEYAAARDHYEAARQSLADQEFGQYIKEEGALHRRIATTFERQGDFDRAIDHLGKAEWVLSVSSLPLPVEEARVSSDIGWVHFRRGEIYQAEKRLTYALEMVKNTTQYDVIASIYNRLGGVCYEQNELAKASDYVRKSLVLREEIGDIVAVARSYNNLGLLGWTQGDWDDALENFSRSMSLNATLGDIEATILLQGNIGLLYTDKGNLQEAIRYLEQSLDQAKRIGHSYLEGSAYMKLSRYWLVAKDWDRSLECCNRSLMIFQPIGARENLVDLYWCKGEAWLGAGNIEEAEKACHLALEALKADTSDDKLPSLERGRILRLQGKIARARGQLDVAANFFAESLTQFSVLNNQFERGKTLAAMALLASVPENREGVQAYASEARRIFQRLGAELDSREVKTY